MFSAEFAVYTNNINIGYINTSSKVFLSLSPPLLLSLLSTTGLFCHILPSFACRVKGLAVSSVSLPASSEEKGAFLLFAGGGLAFSARMVGCGGEKWKQWPEELADVGRLVPHQA